MSFAAGFLVQARGREWVVLPDSTADFLAWNQPEVSVALSGMSTMAQVQENLASVARSGLTPLSES